MLLYRLFLSLTAPLLLIRAAMTGDLHERLGLTPARLPSPGRRLWLHGASNGELTAARPLIERLLARHPELTLIVTCNTLTAREMVQGWGSERINTRLAPLDFRFVVHRFIREWRPDALIVIENELWPNRLSCLHMRKTPVFVVAARISDRSAGRWGSLPGLTRRVIGAISYLAPLDDASHARFAALGLAQERIGPVVNLKAQVGGAEPPAAADLAALRPIFPREQTVLAASTHPGEEEIVLNAFAQARKSRPGLRLILAPRHPRRRAEIAALLERARLPHAIRSEGETPNATTAVYLADTLGEMGLWYSLAGLCFVGGSLVPNGGHTPFEPIAFGAAVAHGPHLDNNAETYRRLQTAGATLPVADGAALAQLLARLSTERLNLTATQAQEIAAQMRGDLQPLIEQIEAHLPRSIP